MAILNGVTLLGFAARTTSGTSDAVDLTAKMTVRPRLEVVAVSGGHPTLDVVIETSKTGNTWTVLGAFDQALAPGLWDESFHDAERYVRANWTIGGSVPGFTFAITAEAQQFYCTAEDLKLELSEETFRQIYDDDNSGEGDTPPAEADIADAQSEVEGYIRGIYTLPIPDPVPRILKHCTEKLAASFAERRHPEYARSDGQDRATVARNLLKGIAARNPRLDIPTEPTAAPNEGFVFSNGRRRGWGE